MQKESQTQMWQENKVARRYLENTKKNSLGDLVQILLEQFI